MTFTDCPCLHGYIAFTRFTSMAERFVGPTQFILKVTRYILQAINYTQYTKHHPLHTRHYTVYTRHWFLDPVEYPGISEWILSSVGIGQRLIIDN